MAHFRLTLEYDGTGFAGWQRQAGGERTVQGTLERALEDVCQSPGRVTGAGRTDAGVHAAGQVAGVEIGTELPAVTLARALNARLPSDVAVVAIEAVPAEFHARFDARSKLYRYRIWNGPVRSPLGARNRHHVPQVLALEPMQEAASELVGTHDFASFQAAGSDVVETVRTLVRAEVTGCPGGEIRLELEGTGFLRHMVRNVAGTLIQVGRGQRAASEIAPLLAARDRRLAGPTAPAHGLILVRVDYGFRRDSEGLAEPVLDGPGPLG